MRNKYHSRDYQQRLQGGIIMWNGEPAVVDEVYENNLLLRPLYNYQKERDEFHEVDAEDPAIDLSRQALGYINTTKDCYYLLQDPNRQYKQSLTTSGMSAFLPSSKSILLRGQGLGSLLFSNYTYDMLMNVYPTVQVAFKRLEEGTSQGVAISRNVAIIKDAFDIKRVFFKQEEVGYTTPALRDTIIIPKDEYAPIISRFLSNFSWKVE